MVIAKVRQRKKNLDTLQSNPNSKARMHFEATMNRPYNFNSARVAITNWQDLDENSNIAFSKAMDVLDVVYEEGTVSQLSQVCKLLEDAVPKVRDAAATQTLIKRKLGRTKTKISTKINNNIEDMKDAVAMATDAIKSNVATNVQNMKDVTPDIGQGQKKTTGKKKEKDKKDEVIESALETMFEKATETRLCDRVLTNHDKLSKRFNIDKIIRESLPISDQYDFIIELCRLIDTYTIPVQSKYNIALENTLYLFNKNNVEYNVNTMVEAVTDYFLIRGNPGTSGLRGMNSVLEDFKFLPKENLEEAFHTINGNMSVDSNEHNIIENTLYPKIVNEAILSTAKDASKNAVKQLLNAFKTGTDKTINGLKSLIIKIYAKKESHILNETPTLFSIIRIFYVLGATTINPVLGIVTFLTDQCIALASNRAEADKLIKQYQSEIEKSENKLKKLENSEDKSHMEAYIKTLKKSLEKIEEHRDTLYTDEENIERNLSTSTGDDGDMGDFDFDFNFDESGMVLEMKASNTLKLSVEKAKKAASKLSDKEKQASRQIDMTVDHIQQGMSRALSNGNREAVIKGSIIPSASKLLKTIGVVGATWAISPFIAVIGAIGAFAVSKKLQAKERQLILDELETESVMVDRYIRMAEERNDDTALRGYLQAKRKIEREKSRLKYHMTITHTQKVQNSSNSVED